MPPKQRANSSDSEARLPLLAPASSSPYTPYAHRSASPSPERASAPSASVLLRERFHRYLVALTAFVVLLLALDAFWERGPLPSGRGIQLEAFVEGVRRCDELSANALVAESVFLECGAPTQRSGNPRHATLSALNGSSTPLLLQHATVWDGLGNKLTNTDVALAHGVILKVGQGLTPKDLVEAANKHVERVMKTKRVSASAFVKFGVEDVEVVDVLGRVVSPGLVDMHSHVGAESVPGFSAESDGNEMSGGPTNPQLRVLDSINPLDLGIETIASGGVTTSLVLPGSGTLMGGEGYAIKMMKTKGNSADDLLLNAGMSLEGGDGKVWRWMKMACGENPKREFGGKGMMPGSRMGNGWMMRERLERARTAMRSQDDWCETAHSLEKQFKSNAHQYISNRFPDSLADESLVALMRRDVRLQVHCYQTNDIDMMIRNKHEFDIPIIAFHHATEAHLLAHKLATENISVALFADHSLYKREAYHHSVRASQILNEAGVKVAFKSDHPVMNAAHLIYEAQKAVHYGLDEGVAFMGVTSVPAERIGAGWRIGRVQEGWDADVVVWDRAPLQLGATPLRVIIDGYTVKSLPTTYLAPPPPLAATPPVSPTLAFPNTQLSAYTVTNISGIYTQENQLLTGKIVVEKGVVTCLGEKCVARGVVLNLNGGVVVPGLVAAGVPLGLEEIRVEEATRDGDAGTQAAVEGWVRGKDGLRVGGASKLLEYAWRSGVLVGVAAPQGEGMVQGVSVGFRTGAERYNEAVLKPDVALHVTIGDSAKSGYANSIASQLSHLRGLLTTPPANSPFTDVVAGKTPLVVTAHEPNDISKLVSLVTGVAPKARLVVAGGSGAWVVADELAAAGVGVLLQGPRCQASSWEMRWCKAYGSGEASSFEILKGAGVKVGFGGVEPDQVRGLLFEAGWGTVGEGRGRGEVMDAVGVVTWRVAELFGLEDGGRMVVGKRGGFVGLDGGPSGFGVKVQVWGDGEFVTTLPQQD
ncbi:hypothetical protein HDU98_000128 [Podochytrium sp. JEL0797]|nr:hypothetical protein HDU98_000128 [Podochytrium sp. JEL0797]